MSSDTRPGGSRTPVSKRGLAVAAIIAVLLVVGVIANATGAGKHAKPRQAGTSNKPRQAARESPSPASAKLPSFAFPGDRHCAITYRTRGRSAMTWTATVTITGQLITHASDKGGDIYRRVVHAKSDSGRATIDNRLVLPA